MRNEIAKPTHVSLAALLSFGILRNKKWKPTEKAQWNIHHIKKLFWQIYAFFVQRAEWLKRRKWKWFDRPHNHISPTIQRSSAQQLT